MTTSMTRYTSKSQCHGDKRDPLHITVNVTMANMTYYTSQSQCHEDKRDLLYIMVLVL